MTLAVIVAAYQTRADWVAQCLTSIDASAARVPAVTVHLRLGVDGCHVTAASLEALGRAYAWSAENVGTYVLRNSLLALGPADAYAIFDADDIMRPDYLPRVTEALATAVLVGPSREDVDADLTPLRFHRYRHGVCAFRHELLAKLGGYKAERLCADADLVARARTVRIHPHILDAPLYLRRRHPASLTQAEGTGFGSVAREQARKRMRHSRDNAGQRVYVHPVTVPLEMRQGREAVA